MESFVGLPVTRCRGADSRARRKAADQHRPALKWKWPKVCHCEGALRPWQSREGSAVSYRLPLKWHAPIASVAALTAQPLAALPPYGCGVPLAGSDRLGGWQYCGTNSVAQCPQICHCEAPKGPWQSRSTRPDNKMAPAKTQLPARDSHVASLLGMTSRRCVPF